MRRATITYTPELLEDARKLAEKLNLRSHGNATHPFKAIVEWAIRQDRERGFEREQKIISESQ